MTARQPSSETSPVADPKRVRAPGSWRSRLLLTLVSLLIGWGLCEAILAFTWHNPYRNEAPDHILKLRIHHPDTDQRIDRSLIYSSAPPSRFRTDARSYILPSFQFENPDVTIAFLGASTTENVTVGEDLRFHALVSDLLAQKGIDANTLNAARSGNTLHDSLNVLLNHVVRDHPDVVVLMHAVNDTGVLRRDPEYGSRMGHAVGLSDVLRWPLQWASRHSSIVAMLRSTRRHGTKRDDTAFREPDAERARRSAPLEPYSRRLRGFVRLCKALEIEPVLMTQPLASSYTELTPEWANVLSQNVFNDAVRQVADEENAILIDLVKFLLTEVDGWGEPMRVFYDGMHVTEDGSRIIAGHIAERLYEEISSAADPVD